MSNLRVILRNLLKTPVVTAVAILSLALGIGANTAMFSMLDQFLLRTLPVPNPEELVFLYHPGPLQGSTSTDENGDPSFSYPLFRELQKQQTPFTGLAGARMFGASLSYNNQPLRGTIHLVSGNYFEVLGVKPALGRLLTESDDQTLGGHPVAVLDHAYWTTRFGADPGVLNRTIVINGHSMTIVGVTQKGFRGERTGSTVEAFAPITMKAQMTPDFDGTKDRRNHWVTLLGRIKPGMTIAQAQTAINIPYVAQLEEDIKLLQRPGESFLKRFRAKKIVLKPGEHGRGGLHQEARNPLFLMIGMTAMVLLIACSNIANLLLARAAAREKEIAMRLAIGASRTQLIRQLLTEAWVLAIAGGLLGLAVADATVRFIVASIPDEQARFLSTTLDLKVLGYSALLCILTGLLFGLFPAFQATRQQLALTLRDQTGQTSGSRSANRFRQVLVTAQVALCLSLLISAGLFGRSLVNLSRVNLGIRIDHLITFSIDPKLNKYNQEQTLSLYERMEERLAAIPGVTLVAATQVPAIAGSNWGQNITVEGFVAQSDDANNVNFAMVGPGYFRTMGMALMSGREFTPADNKAGLLVAVVNQTFAKFYFGSENALGRRLAQGAGNNLKYATIVGVIKDTKYSSLKEQPRRVFYMPYKQTQRVGAMHFYVRTGVDPGGIAGLIRREVGALDSNLPIHKLRTMQAQIEENLFVERLLTSLTASFAGLAVLLAAIGLYGVLSYTVTRRTKEIGVRMALGAAAGQVRGLIAREVAWMLGIGAVLGVAGALGIGRVVETMLFGLKGWDLAVFCGAVVVTITIAVAAAFVPARRATRIDPMVALRCE